MPVYGYHKMKEVEIMDILKSEIKKAEKLANTLTNKKDCRVTGTYYNGVLDWMGWAVVRCEICSDNMTEREIDINVNVFTPDRRRSFASRYGR